MLQHNNRHLGLLGWGVMLKHNLRLVRWAVPSLRILPVFARQVPEKRRQSLAKIGRARFRPFVAAEAAYFPPILTRAALGGTGGLPASAGTTGRQAARGTPPNPAALFPEGPRGYTGWVKGKVERCG